MNMPSPEKPKTLIFSVGAAWRDARDALSALFLLALIAFLIFLTLGIITPRIMPATGLTSLLYGAVTAFLMTPYAIAVHRFIILGERTKSYRIALAERRFWRFFGWSLALSVLANAPASISTVLSEPTISKGYSASSTSFSTLRLLRLECGQSFYSRLWPLTRRARIGAMRWPTLTVMRGRYSS
jgi:hypothetical protein